MRRHGRRSRSTLAVDASKAGAKIDRNIFGQFAEHLGHGIYEGVWVGPDSPIPNTRGIRNDVVAALKALKVPNVRWPGGCFADEYHWRNGIGPRRRASDAQSRTGAASSSRTRFGTHEFMDFVEQIGGEAYLSVNVGSGTPQEAADWLEYLTTAQPTTLAKERAANGHAAPYKVAFLGIGNESWDCGGNMTPEYYVSQLKIYSRFVRNFNPAQQQDGHADAEDRRRPRRRRAALDASGPNDHEGVAGPQVELGHRRPVAAQLHGRALAAGVQVGRLRRSGVRPDPQVDAGDGRPHRDARGDHGQVRSGEEARAGRRRVGRLVRAAARHTSGLPGAAEQPARRALAALNLNIFARHADRVRMANIAQMVNVLQAMILTDKEKMLLTPTYHVFRMYVPFQDATFVPVTFDAGTYTHGDITLPRVDAIAAKDAAGTLWLALTNLDPNRPPTSTRSLTGLAARVGIRRDADGAGVDSVNTFEAPNTVAPKPMSAKVAGWRLSSLEPKSVTVISVEQ